MRKTLLTLVAVILLASLGLLLWARAVFAQDTVRAALVSQLSHALGQPVSVGSTSASVGCSPFSTTSPAPPCATAGPARLVP